MITDLRSDTFTKPTPGMLEAMMKAEVGDDVFGEDPTVNELEATIASVFGMESSLFCPSGTMANQIAIKCHTQPGNEVICEKQSHVYIYEGAGIAFNSGCQVKALDGDRGRIKAGQVESMINPPDIHKARTALVVVENTANRGGGSCYEFNDLQSIKELCLKNNLKLHLDGARLWNALISTKESYHQYGELFDSMMVSLSKGLGAPVGSMLIGSHEFIRQARRIRKVLGGGMRQAGYLAAAGIYAIENHIERLQQDHIHARKIAAELIKKDFIGKILPVETNILIFEVTNAYTPVSFTEYLKKKGILCIAISPTQVRMVTHLDITPKMVDELVHILDRM
jgi:threonine aldolase